MNILLLNWKDIKNPEAGGAEVIAFEFAKRLVKDGHVVTFFSRSFPNALPDETVEGVTIRRRGNKLSVYLYAFLYYQMLRVKPDKVVDMVNTLCWQTPLYIPQDKRIAYVNQLAKEVLFYEFPWYLSYISYLLERLEYLPYRNTKTLSYSKSTARDLELFGIRKKNIHLFPLGIDHDRYKPEGKKTTYPLFIFVARLVKMKRAEICIKAMQSVVKKHADARLCIIGNGPNEDALSMLIDELKLKQSVKIVNKNNFYINKYRGDIKVKYMQEAWALVLPSVKEGWGMVVTEAAACGTPAIVSDVTGLRDSVINKKTGIILSKDPTPEEMASSMEQIITNKKMREIFSKNSVNWSDNFTWEKSYTVFKRLILS